MSRDPIITVKSQSLPNFRLHQDLSDVDIKLIDYGSRKDYTTFFSWLFKFTRFTTATYVAKRPGESEIQPILLRAHEVVFGQPWSTLVGIWCVGLSVRNSLFLSGPAHQESVLWIFELLADIPLIQIYESPCRCSLLMANRSYWALPTSILGKMQRP